MPMTRQRITSLGPLTAPAPSSTVPAGSRSKIDRFVLSIDIGATKSAVTAAVRFSGKAWQIVQVSRWNGQEGKDLHEKKVPTVLLYDNEGKTLIACGAEATTLRMRTQAEKSGWQYVRNFKILLHPKRHLIDIESPPLPANIKVHRVYTDFLKYLVEHAKTQMMEWFGGRDIWRQASPQVEIVLTTPNKWGKQSQSELEKAVISAGLLSPSRASKALYFVEEGEAAARFYLLHDTSGFAATKLEVGTNFLVCDAGGCTVDISSYEVAKKTSSQLRLKEIGAPDSVLAGGCKVDEEFVIFLRRMFSKTRLAQDKVEVDRMINVGLRDFEANAKRSFAGLESLCDILVAGEHESDPELDIDHGLLSIESQDAETFFRLPFNLINAALQRQTSLNKSIECIILTGGFGESPYLKRLIKESFPTTDVFTATGSTSQAVSVGALLLVIGGGEVRVERVERAFQTWATDFVKRARQLVGLAPS